MNMKRFWNNIHQYTLRQKIGIYLMENRHVLMCSGKVNRFCSISHTLRVTYVKNVVKSNVWGNAGIWLQKTECIRDHLWHRNSVTVNPFIMETIKCCMTSTLPLGTPASVASLQMWSTIKVSLIGITCNIISTEKYIFYMQVL
jgi:hypothetical protein